MNLSRLWIGLLTGLMVMPIQGAQPWRPSNDQQVVEVLRSRPLSSTERAWRELRARLRDQPRDVVLATQVARLALQQARQESDPRWMGQAQAALSPWWTQAQAPDEVLLLRATMRQSQHAFDDALQDLNTLLSRQPSHAQAWLLKASVLQVTGRMVPAAQACEAVIRAGARWHGELCRQEVLSLNGQAIAAGKALLALSVGAAPTEARQLAIVQAELAERLGDARQADARYQSLMDNQVDAYALGAYADFLLDQGRPKDVIDLLRGHERHDGLLLRLALAQQAMKAPQLPGTMRALQARFDASQLRGDSVHQREEARFELHLKGRPTRALQLAKANWVIQKEPADARLLLEASRATGQDAAAQALRDLLASQGLQDERLKGLL